MEEAEEAGQEGKELLRIIFADKIRHIQSHTMALFLYYQYIHTLAFIVSCKESNYKYH